MILRILPVDRPLSYPLINSVRRTPCRRSSSRAMLLAPLPPQNITTDRALTVLTTFQRQVLDPQKSPNRGPLGTTSRTRR